jgi:long-chain fatty acid transport protein
MEFPDNGSEQQGRGGAWVARASDPLAAFYNPAGLAGQPTRLTLQANLSSQSTCFARIKALGDPTQGDGVAPGGAYPRVCSDGGVFPNPQIGFTWRATDRIGVGLLVLGPSAVGNVTWPEFVGTTASPGRYLLLKENVVFLTPTIGIGWEALDGLRLGASFQAGLAPTIDLVNASVADGAYTGANAPAYNDVRSELFAKTFFVPGFTLGALWSATDALDVAAWYKWSAPIDPKGDVQTASSYFTPAVARGNTSGVTWGDTSVADCNYPHPPPPAQQPAPLCGAGNNAQVKLPIPMEAKLGLRYHQPRRGLRMPLPLDSRRRDPMSQDVFDVEADFTWANDSAVDAVQVRFPATVPNGDGLLPANSGLPTATIPPNADVPHSFRDVVGVRVGGDYTLLPDQLSLRAGAFFETRAARATYQDIDFDAAARFGVSLGGTYRIQLGQRSLDLMLGYGHVFFSTLENSAPNAAGLRALAGTACTLPPDPAGTTATCPASGTQKFRTDWPVNLGSITSAMNLINVGATLAF